ncbi:MAG: hypothetical protein ACK4TA_15430 [Saprospiraceae bacterium]
MKLELELKNPQKLSLLLELLSSLDFVKQVKVAEETTMLSPEEKLQMANHLRAEATQTQWAVLSEQLPDVPDISMEEIVAEVKEVRRMRSQQ